MKYYEVHVSMTSKTVGSKDRFSMYDKQVNTFASLSEVKKFLDENYKGKRRNKIFIDGKNGQAKHIGYVYIMGIVSDYSHSDGGSWYQQDWVELKEMQSTMMIV